MISLVISILVESTPLGLLLGSHKSSSLVHGALRDSRTRLINSTRRSLNTRRACLLGRLSWDFPISFAGLVLGLWNCRLQTSLLLLFIVMSFLFPSFRLCGLMFLGGILTRIDLLISGFVFTAGCTDVDKDKLQETAISICGLKIFLVWWFGQCQDQEDCDKCHFRLDIDYAYQVPTKVIQCQLSKIVWAVQVFLDKNELVMKTASPTVSLSLSPLSRDRSWH